MTDEATQTVPSTWYDIQARNQRSQETEGFDLPVFNDGMNNASCGNVIGVAVDYGELNNDPTFDDGVNGLGTSGDPSSWTLHNGLPKPPAPDDAEIRDPSRGQSIGGLAFEAGSGPQFTTYNPSKVFVRDTDNDGTMPATPQEPNLITTAAGWVAITPA
jgi:hypothetical protein